MRYCHKILTLPPDNADHPLIVGQALHTGLEKGVDAGIREYFMSYPIITDNHINEAIKLQTVIPKAAAMIPKGEFEVKISNDYFTGFIDLLTPVELTLEEKDGICSKCEKDTECDYAYGSYNCGKIKGTQWFDLYDFKYSNNVSGYKKSKQLHLYKYFWERENPGKKIRKMYFLFAPKVNIKQKKTESLGDFRNRLIEELRTAEPELVDIQFDMNQVVDFLLEVQTILEAKNFPKNQGYLCNWCEYQDYCQKGNDYMLLPKNERRNIEKIEKKVVWLYGAPFSGKTTFANKFPDPLMLNTDGNIKFVDAPFVPIKDEVTKNGRMTNRKLAWAVFKEAIEELEKKENDFKTIIVDLLEDCYEHCRLYMYDQMGITHESDDSFRAWDKVRTEFLSTLKRLMNLDYENIILISHEDSSKDITKKGGDKITSIKPNLQDKAANKVAGMVDIVARVVADGENHTLSFKTSEVIFGGGRLTVSTNEIPLEYDAFLKVYEEANKNAVAKLKGEPVTAANGSDKPATGRKGRTRKETPPTPDEAANDENMSSDGDAKQNDPVENAMNQPEKAADKDAPADTSAENGGEDDKPPFDEDKKADAKPATRTRRKRG